MNFSDLEVLLDVPLVASVVLLSWPDGTATVELVTAEDITPEAYGAAYAIIPEGFHLSIVDLGLDDTPLGVPGTIRTYRQAAHRATA